MYFSPSIDVKDLDHLIRRTLSIGTVPSWTNRIKSLEQEAKYNPFAHYFNSERYVLELDMERVRKRWRVARPIPDISTDPTAYRLYAFAAMLVKVYDRLPPHSQKVLAGRVRGGLKDEVGLAPLAFELLMASNLMRKGAEIEWHDLEHGGFDFIARRGAATAEVECKTFSADIGRKVHQKRQYQLGGLIGSELKQALA